MKTESVCQQCGKTFMVENGEINRGRGKYCSYKCSADAKTKDLTGKKFGRLTVLSQHGRNRFSQITWDCLCDCGNATVVRGDGLTGGQAKSCGCLRRDVAAERGHARVGEKNHWWKGGKYTDPKGYVFVQQTNHPHAMSNGYVAEHRLICEKVHGILDPSECVHHINGNPSDNRVKNLAVFPSRGDHTKFHTWIKSQAKKKEWENRTSKTCSKCKVEKPFSEFRKSERHISGRVSWCNECVNAQKREHRAVAKLTLASGVQAP